MNQTTAIMIAVGAILLFGIIPFALNRRFVKEYGESTVHPFLVLLQVVGTLVSVYFSVDTASSSFIISIIITIVIYIIAAAAGLAKAAMLGAHNADCVLSAIVHILIPMGIVLIILCAFTENSGKKKRRRRK